MRESSDAPSVIAWSPANGSARSQVRPMSPRVPMKELKPPNLDQVVQLFRLAQQADPELATFITLAASSGARRGELIALRWKDIDVERGRLLIETGHRVGGWQPHRTGHEDASESTNLPRWWNRHCVESPPGAGDGASPKGCERRHPRVSCSAILLTARHPGIPTRPLELSGKSVGRPGSRAFDSMI
jgi:hypothetical protein